MVWFDYQSLYFEHTPLCKLRKMLSFQSAALGTLFQIQPLFAVNLCKLMGITAELLLVSSNAAMPFQTNPLEIKILIYPQIINFGFVEIPSSDKICSAVCFMILYGWIWYAAGSFNGLIFRF